MLLNYQSIERTAILRFFANFGSLFLLNNCQILHLTLIVYIGACREYLTHGMNYYSTFYERRHTINFCSLNMMMSMITNRRIWRLVKALVLCCFLVLTLLFIRERDFGNLQILFVVFIFSFKVFEVLDRMLV